MYLFSSFIFVIFLFSDLLNQSLLICIREKRENAINGYFSIVLIFFLHLKRFRRLMKNNLKLIYLKFSEKYEIHKIMDGLSILQSRICFGAWKERSYRKKFTLTKVNK